MSDRGASVVMEDMQSLGGRSGFTMMEESLPTTALAMQVDPQLWLSQELRNLNIDEMEFRRKQKILLQANKAFEFVPRDNYIIDRKIDKVLKLTKSKQVPVVHLRSKVYMVALNKLTFNIKGDYLVVEVGKDRWERFATYITENNTYFMDRLTLLSISNNDMSIQEIVNRKIARENLIDPADMAQS